MKTLHLDESIDKSPVQDKNAILDVLKELSGLSHTSNGENRAHLAHKLVAVMRKLNADTLSAALPEALEISPSLTYQALFQCGTPECSSALMQILRTFKSSFTEIDAVVYAMGMVPNPSRELVKEMLEMAKFKPSKLIYYATSNAVRRCGIKTFTHHHFYYIECTNELLQLTCYFFHVTIPGFIRLKKESPLKSKQ